jgi:hypothetical protein
MEAWWNDPLSDTGVAKAKEEKHELRVDKAGLLMEAAEANRSSAHSNWSCYPPAAKPAAPATRSSGPVADKLVLQ